MKIYNCDELIANIKFDLKCVNWDDINDDGNNILLPYGNEEFLSAIRPLMDDVVKETRPSWKEPDYAKSRTYLYITEDSIRLSVEVLPKCYSAKEKQTLLQNASQDIRGDGLSEYLDLMDMFDDISDILSTSNPSGEICTYRLELTEDERGELSSTCS